MRTCVLQGALKYAVLDRVTGDALHVHAARREVDVPYRRGWYAQGPSTHHGTHLLCCGAVGIHGVNTCVKHLLEPGGGEFCVEVGVSVSLVKALLDDGWPLKKGARPHALLRSFEIGLCTLCTYRFSTLRHEMPSRGGHRWLFSHLDQCGIMLQYLLWVVW